MANIISTEVEIGNPTKEIIQLFKSIEENITDNFNIPMDEFIKFFFDIDIDDEDEYTYGWRVDNLGAKWVYIQDFDIDDDNTIHMTFHSAWRPPFEMFDTMSAFFDKNTYMGVVYIDEFYNFYGSAIYTADYFKDVEMTGEFDIDRFADDDEYMDDFYTKLYDTREKLIQDFLSKK